MLRGHPQKKQRNTSGLKNHHQSAPRGNENDAPTISTNLKREVNVRQPREQLKDGVGSEVEESSLESDEEDEEDGVSLEWGGFGEEGFGQRLADMAHNDDPNDIDWIPACLRKKYITKKGMQLTSTCHPY